MNSVTPLRALGALLIAAALSACGGGGSNANAITVTVTPSTADLETGESLSFRADVAGTSDTRVSWSVKEANGGAISQTGTYTAPDAPGVYTVVATSAADSSKTGSATVTVKAPEEQEVTISISPMSAALDLGETVQFTAEVTGAADTSVTWSVEEGAAAGTIDANGLYTAPQTAGTYHVVATSNADATKVVRATVTVTSPQVVQVAVTPTSVSLVVGQTQQFLASVAGTQNTAVTWSVLEGAAGGTIDNAGLYTAPVTPGTYHVVATSVADATKSATATVTVLAPNVVIAVTPSSASLQAGQTQQFTATVTGTSNTAVTWSVQEGAAGGTVDATGLYTSPAAAGTFHVVATSVADTSKTAVATVTVTQTVAISLAPTSASMQTGATQQFTATVTGTSNTAVTWSVQEGAAGGSVDAAGLYTAPGTAGTYHVVATSVADTSKTAMATVTVTAPPVVSVSVSPNNASVQTGMTQQFAATVTGTTNTAVTWSVQEGAAGGTVDATGLYTAPGTAGTYHVVATSVADSTQSAIATVTVTSAPVVAVSISPTTASVQTGATQQFAATVTGNANTAVTWNLQEGAAGGTVDATGLYTAPGTAGTYHVVATSVADTSKSAVATVTVTPAPVVSISIAPTTASVQTGATRQFTATVTGSSNTTVFWTVQEGAAGGSVDSNGLYTAPGTVGTYHVVATAAADTSQTAVATVTVTAPPVSISIAPATASVQTGGSQQFTATVTGSSNTTVFWTVQEGAAGGSVTSNGLYTAPGTAGTFHVVATAAADTSKTAVATVTVSTAPVISVSLSPASATVEVSENQQFTATVTGTGNTQVTWSVQETGGGTVSNTGLYTAPATGGIFHVEAQSVADPTKTAVATVTVLPASFSITGTVTNPTGKAGRVYLFLYGGNRVGTSVPIAANGTANFTLRGAQGSGTVALYAYLDTLGLGTWNDASSPWGGVNVTLTGADLTGAAITLADVTPVTPPAPATEPDVVPGNGEAWVFFDRVPDANNLEAASHYRIYWNTSPNPTAASNLGSLLVRSGTNAVVTGLTAGLTYYFSYAAVNQGVEGPASTGLTPHLIQAPTAGSTLSGTVTFGGLVPTGPLYVAAYGQTTSSLVRIPNPSTSQSFTLGGVASEAIYLYAFIDQGNDGEVTAIDLNNIGDPMLLTVTSNQSGIQVPLATTPGFASVTTTHGVWSGGDDYALRLVAGANYRMPVKVAVLSGPGILGPVDLGPDFSFTGYHTGSSLLELARPFAGDTYTFELTWTDGTTSTLTSAVTNVIVSTPTNLLPSMTGTTSPTFSWTAPSGITGPFDYVVQVYDYNTGNVMWDVTLPSSQTSVAYNVDGTGVPLVVGDIYQYYVYAVDPDGNYGWGYNYFTAQ